MMAYSLVLIFMFAIIAVAVGVVGLMLKLGGAVVRALFGAPCSAAPTGHPVCATRGCGYDNRPGARYCAQCGRRLDTGGRGRR